MIYIRMYELELNINGRVSSPDAHEVSGALGHVGPHVDMHHLDVIDKPTDYKA